MPNRVEPNHLPDPLDELVDKLLDSGGVFSQIVHHMFEFELSEASGDDLAPVLEVAHSLVRSVVSGLGEHHSVRDVRVASKVVQEVTDAICEEVFLYSAAPDAGESSDGDRAIES